MFWSFGFTLLKKYIELVLLFLSVFVELVGMWTTRRVVQAIVDTVVNS